MKQKVLVFIEDGSFTYDNRVKREVDALLKNRWEVTVVCPKFKGDNYFKKVNDNLRVLFFPKYNGNGTIGHLFEHFMTLVFGVMYTIYTKIRYGFKVFHACNPTDFLWMIYYPYRFFGVKFIFDQHDLSPEVYLSRPGTKKGDLFYKILNWHEKKSYSLANSVISTNESYKRVAISRGKVIQTDAFVVRNGPMLDRFNLKKIVPIKEQNRILVGYLGNMNLPDGVDEILYAAKEIISRGKISNISFLLIGGGANQPNLVKQSISMGISEFVKFTGRVDDEQMLSLLRGCDICVQPDPYNPLNNVSTMNKVMEYMALEKPFVAYDLVETRVSGGNCGLYAKINDRSDFADKIVQLAVDSELRMKLGKRGRKRIENQLEWNNSVPHLIDAYNNVFKDKQL
jgi:glycosyltransferase involved in cell wall biosynthesis